MKTRYLIPALLLAALSAVSCDKEQGAPVIDVVTGDTVTLNATIGLPDTKLHFSGDKGTYTETRWQAGDCIWVRSDTQPHWEKGDCFRTSADAISADGHSAAFTGRTRKDGRLCAVYPYGRVKDLSDNDKVLLDIPRTEELVIGDSPAGSNLAAAFWADGSTSFTMKYILGAVKFSLTGEGWQVNRFELIDADPSNALWGECEVVPDYENKDIASVTVKNDDPSRNRISLETSVVLGSTPVEFYFMLPPGSLAKGFTLKAYGPDDSVVAVQLTGRDNTVAAGKVVKMPAAQMIPPPVEGVAFEGSGTETGPYLIASAENLLYLSQVLTSADYESYADKYYVQTADIDMDNIEFVPLGARSAKPFCGVYDGQGFAITNLETSGGADSDNPASGLFGYAEGAAISNVILTNRINTGYDNRVAGLVGKAVGCTVSGCVLTGGELGAVANMCAGIVAEMKGGKVEKCTVAEVKISDTYNYCGGIVAYAYNGAIIKECSAEGAVISAVDYCGGIVGQIENSSIEDCAVAFRTEVTGSGHCVGGIVGYMKAATPSTVKDCTVTGQSVITGTKNVGGIVGWLETGTVRNCLVYGQSEIVSTGGDGGAGGICGRAISKSGTENLFDNCCVTDGTIVKAPYSAGGILGYAYPDSNGVLYIINSGINNATVRATSCDTGADPAKGDCMSAGICGWMRLSDSGSKGYIVNCYSYMSSIVCDLNMSHPSVGGIVGYGSVSSAGALEIANCATNLVGDRLIVNGAPYTGSSRVGALYGYLPNNAVVKVNDCHYVDDGVLGIGPSAANIVVSNNTGYAESVFTDGTTVVPLLNAFASGFTARPLRQWTVFNGLPITE